MAPVNLVMQALLVGLTLTAPSVTSKLMKIHSIYDTIAHIWIDEKIFSKAGDFSLVHRVLPEYSCPRTPRLVHEILGSKILSYMYTYACPMVSQAMHHGTSCPSVQEGAWWWPSLDYPRIHRTHKQILVYGGHPRTILGYTHCETP